MTKYASSILQLALNHEKVGKYSKLTTKTKRFKYEYNSERINYPSEKGEWKKI